MTCLQFRIVVPKLIAVALLAVLSGCPQQEAAANGNTALDAMSCAKDPDPVGEPTEAKYPYQVIASLAQVYLQYNITDEALRLFELAINTQFKQTGNEDAEYWTGFGDALVKAGRKQEAAKAYERALRIYETLFQENTDASRHNFFVQRIALLCRVLGNEKEANNWLARLKADDNSAPQQVALAGIFEDQQDFERAEAGYKRALVLTQSDARLTAEVNVAYAAMLNKAGRQDEAIALGREIVTSTEASEETLRIAKRLLFDIYEARGELEKLEFK